MTDRTTTQNMAETGDALAALAARAEEIGASGAPVERWNPPDCGAIDMEIRADGRWFYQGSEIRREPLVRLFASVLRRDADGATYLVTPAEKLRITVEDRPFRAVEMARTVEDGVPVIRFRTDRAGLVTADADHPLLLPLDPQAAFSPTLLVRGRLEARLTRALSLDLAEWLEEEGDALVLRSAGARFPMPKPGGGAHV